MRNAVERITSALPCADRDKALREYDARIRLKFSEYDAALDTLEEWGLTRSIDTEELTRKDHGSCDDAHDSEQSHDTAST